MATALKNLKPLSDDNLSKSFDDRDKDSYGKVKYLITLFHHSDISDSFC